MKAPDKIYVAESLIKTPYGNEWSPTPYISREDTEYIRKDALLEWAEEKRVALLNCDATEERIVAALSVCDTFIDKIESL